MDLFIYRQLTFNVYGRPGTDGIHRTSQEEWLSLISGNSKTQSELKLWARQLFRLHPQKIECS